MINSYALKNGALTPQAPLVVESVWVDIKSPTREEELFAEKLLGTAIPTHEEMSEIEPSNRLYIENGAAFLTASLMCNTEQGAPKLASTTFILNKERLITVRYDEPKSFAIFLTRAMKPKAIDARFDAVFGLLIDTVIDRTADILEKLSSEIEIHSETVFTEKKSASRTYKNLIMSLGRKGNTLSKVRESLVSLSRMLIFVQSLHDEMALTADGKSLIKTQIRDVEYLTQHVDSLTTKVTFLHEATLGLVSLEQNTIIKIFSVASVAMMPPTLIASIYGMNFKFIPEFNWELGYPYALGLMVCSAIVPFIFFKWKGWL